MTTTQAVGSLARPVSEGVAARATVMRRRRRQRRMLVWIGWLLTAIGVLWLAMVMAASL